jgi:hypothetical protein
MFTTGRSREYNRAEDSSIARAKSGVRAARKTGPRFSSGGIGGDIGVEAMATADVIGGKIGKRQDKEIPFIYITELRFQKLLAKFLGFGKNPWTHLRTWSTRLVELQESGWDSPGSCSLDCGGVEI